VASEKYQTADTLKGTGRKKFIYVLIILSKGVPKNENFSDWILFSFAFGVVAR
jgi:hypothetical protein